MVAKRKIRRIIKKPPLRKIGRKLRGLITECENCGLKRQELFKIYTFKQEKEEAHFYCRQCYSRIMSGKKLGEF